MVTTLLTWSKSAINGFIVSLSFFHNLFLCVAMTTIREVWLLVIIRERIAFEYIAIYCIAIYG